MGFNMTDNEKKLQLFIVQQTREWNRSNMLGYASATLAIEELIAIVIADNVKAIAATESVPAQESSAQG